MNKQHLGLYLRALGIWGGQVVEQKIRLASLGPGAGSFRSGTLTGSSPFRGSMDHQPQGQDDPEGRAETYRQSADRLRDMAGQIRFDFCRRKQLVSLADAFDRLADRLEGSPVKQAAD